MPLSIFSDLLKTPIVSEKLALKNSPGKPTAGPKIHERETLSKNRQGSLRDSRFAVVRHCVPQAYLNQAALFRFEQHAKRANQL